MLAWWDIHCHWKHLPHQRRRPTTCSLGNSLQGLVLRGSTFASKVCCFRHNCCGCTSVRAYGSGQSVNLTGGRHLLSVTYFLCKH